MGKVLVVLLIALGAALYFPESREVVVETTQPVLNPWHRWMTQQEMERIVDDLETVDASQGRLPSGTGEFDAWMDDRYPSESSRMDGWGTRYRLEVVGSTFRVISAGPDQEFGTDGDIVREGTRAGPAGRR